MPKLTIAIATVVEREGMFKDLMAYLKDIAPEWVEVIFECDNKEISIGSKRQNLLNAAQGEYIMFLDDDDSIPEYYFDTLLPAFEQSPDAIGYIEQCGDKLVPHSHKYNGWRDNYDGYPHVRTIFCKDPIKTNIAREAGFKDMRYGEDHDFSRRVKKLIKTEVFIDKVMYLYNQPGRLSTSQHKQRYGI